MPARPAAIGGDVMNDLTRETLDRLCRLPDEGLRLLFHRLDHEGRAEPVGDEHDVVEQALDGEGFAVIDSRPDEDGVVCIGHRGGQVVIACDTFGPWMATVYLDDLEPTDAPPEPWLMPPDPRPLTARLAELTR